MRGYIPYLLPSLRAGEPTAATLDAARWASSIFTFRLRIGDQLLCSNVTIVYGSPGCQKCSATTRYLDRHDVPYEYRDVTTDEAAAREAHATGFQRLPIVTTPVGQWDDFQIARLDALRASLVGS